MARAKRRTGRLAEEKGAGSGYVWNGKRRCPTTLRGGTGYGGGSSSYKKTKESLFKGGSDKKTRKDRSQFTGVK